MCDFFPDAAGKLVTCPSENEVHAGRLTSELPKGRVSGVSVKPKPRRESSRPRLHFKGGGFYVNDYPGKSSAPASEPAPAEAKTPCGGSCGAACPAVAAAASAATSDLSKN